jgi:Icc-related predicted phosphoesterase
MKILALTDIHAAYRKAEEIITKESPDVCIIGGDLTTVGTIKEAENALNNFRQLSQRLYCLAGNMDMPQHDDLYDRLRISLNAHGEIIDHIGFLGVSSAPISPLHTPYEITEEEIARRIHEGYKHVKDAKKKILVSHSPPYGTKLDITHSGIHVGSTALRDFIEDHQPDVVICGHIHEGRGQDAIENSRIVNCGAAKQGNYVIVEILGDHIEIKNLQHFDHRL